MRTEWPWWSVFLRGAAMGAADVVPGVSGGTMALVLGIYERLVAALRAATGAAPWRALRREGLRAAWSAADGRFLLPLVTGIATSVLLLARVIEGALVDQRVLLYAAFTGLIAASAWVVARQVRDRRPAIVAIAVGAAALTFVVLGLAPTATPQATWFLVLAGAVGISALVLPGISGAFILVLLGQYETVLGAIGRGDLAVLAPFALGALAGLATIVRLLHALLRRAREPTLAALTGIMVGSLRRLWPWQAPLGVADAAVPSGEELVAVLPSEALGPEGWVVATVVAVAAAGVVVLLERGSRSATGRPFSSHS